MPVIQHSGANVPAQLFAATAVGVNPPTKVVEGLKETQTFAHRLNKQGGQLASANTNEFTQGISFGMVKRNRIPQNVVFKNGASNQFQEEVANPSTWIINRLHFVPEVVDLGILTGFKTTYFNLWCTYLRPQELSNILPTNDGGLVLDTGIVQPPYELASFGYYEMSITANPEGANVIDANYDFNMTNTDVWSLNVTGLRSSVFGHRHNWNNELIESYEWLTGVVTATDGTEIRSPLRYYPRIKVNHASLITPSQIADFRNKMEVWHSKSFTVPLWQRQQLLQVQALANDTEILIGTSELGARAEGSVLLSLGWDDYELVQVQEVQADRLILTAPLNSTWKVGTVVSPVVAGTPRNPVRVSGITTTMATLDSITFEVDKQNVKDFLPDGTSVIDEFQGEPVFPFRPNWLEANQETYAKPQQKKVDYQTAAPIYFDDAATAVHTVPWNYLIGGRDNIMKLREFLFRVEGRHRSFWQPDYSKAFSLALPTGANGGTLTCYDNNYIRDLYGKSRFKYICVELRSGAIYYREIVNATINDQDLIVLSLDSTFPEEVSEYTVKNISYMRRWRLDSDTVTLNYVTDTIVKCALSMVTIGVD